eukprot:3797026-Lingulodinium_polyedra.AAC.1
MVSWIDRGIATLSSLGAQQHREFAGTRTIAVWTVCPMARDMARTSAQSAKARPIEMPFPRQPSRQPGPA